VPPKAVKAPQHTPKNPVKDKFVKVPLWWAEQAARAVNSSQMFVCIWLLRLAWEKHSTTFPLANAGLAKWGISREAKRRALASLEKAGLISVQRRAKRSPIVTLLYLP
jgi:hypothetical protein